MEKNAGPDQEQFNYAQPKHDVAEIQAIGRSTDLASQTLECQVQIVASKVPNLFTKCAEQAQHIRALMLSDGMLVL